MIQRQEPHRQQAPSQLNVPTLANVSGNVSVSALQTLIGYGFVGLDLALDEPVICPCFSRERAQHLEVGLVGLPLVQQEEARHRRHALMNAHSPM